MFHYNSAKFTRYSSRRTVHEMPMRSRPEATLQVDDPFADENENQPPEDDIDFGDDQDSDELDLGESTMSGSIAVRRKYFSYFFYFFL